MSFVTAPSDPGGHLSLSLWAGRDQLGGMFGRLHDLARERSSEDHKAELEAAVEETLSESQRMKLGPEIDYAATYGDDRAQLFSIAVRLGLAAILIGVAALSYTTAPRPDPAGGDAGSQSPSPVEGRAFLMLWIYPSGAIIVAAILLGWLYFDLKKYRRADDLEDRLRSNPEGLLPARYRS